ncbi:hypothetical protein V2G26_017374 [Clonostachys chloroleuca]
MSGSLVNMSIRSSGECSCGRMRATKFWRLISDDLPLPSSSRGLSICSAVFNLGHLSRLIGYSITQENARSGHR